MTAFRSRKEHIEYKRYLQKHKDSDEGCLFCAINSGSPQFIKQTPNFKIIRNIFGYSIWDSQRVTDHLLIVPLQHTDTLKDIPAKASKEFIDLISRYEQDGYNVYARAPVSTKKTIVHQHTHLIKVDGDHLDVVLHIRNPYFRFVR